MGTRILFDLPTVCSVLNTLALIERFDSIVSVTFQPSTKCRPLIVPKMFRGKPGMSAKLQVPPPEVHIGSMSENYTRQLISTFHEGVEEANKK